MPHVDSNARLARDAAQPVATPVASPRRSAALVRAYAANDPAVDAPAPAGAADLAVAAEPFPHLDALAAGRLDSIELHRRAVRARARYLGEALAAGAAALRRLVLDAVQRFRRMHAMRATRVELDELDDRTLRDLGLHRSEIATRAADIGSDAERTRARAMLASRGILR